MAIVVSLTDQWELKDSSIVGAMCTAIAPHTDPRVVSGLLYMVSVRYLIRNIPTIVENDDIDISPLPLDTVMEIAQSEEVAAPEIQLYHFLRKWTEKNHHKLTLEQTQNLFSHVRYATIPHIELETITKYFSNNNHKLWSALGSCPSFDQGVTADIQFEEEALPKIYNAADFLQLDNLKMAIVVSLTDQWELKDSSIVGAMCTAIAPHTDPRVVSGLLYMVSVRYLIRNIPTIVENDDIDISPLPLSNLPIVNARKIFCC
jgi:hypothetical protein